jgi:hypothetical protein
MVALLALPLQKNGEFWLHKKKSLQLNINTIKT